MRKKKKLFISIGIIVIVILVVMFNVGKSKGRVEVSAAIVKKGSIISHIRADGTLKGLNQVDIGGEVMGKIVKMRVKEGDRVYKGDILCIIDQSTYKSRENRAVAAFQLSKSKLTKTEADLGRTKELYKSGLVSEENYESAKLKYEVALAEVKSNKESYNEAKAVVEKTIIRSPVAGEVIQRNKEEGEMAITGTVNTPGSVIMTIAERSTMFVRALIDETEIVKVELGYSTTVTIDAFQDTVFNGKVVKIGGLPIKSGTEETVNFPIEVEISETPEKLYPGMSASCEIRVGCKDSVIVIPYMSLGTRKIKGKEEDIVILSKKGKAEIVTVKLGLTGEKGVEVIEGISLGDTILTGPYKKLRELKDGDKIEAKIKAKQGPESKNKRGKRKGKISARVKIG